MKPLFQLLLVLAVINALGLGGLWYGSTIMREKKDQETQLRADIAEEQQKWKKLAVLRRALVLAEKDRAAVSKYFYGSSEESQIKFISEIERLGNVTGTTVKTESLEYASQEPRSFRGNFGVMGSWEQVYHMLRLIEEYPGRMVINRVSVTEGKLDEEHKKPFWGGSFAIELQSIRPTE